MVSTVISGFETLLIHPRIENGSLWSFLPQTLQSRFTQVIYEVRLSVAFSQISTSGLVGMSSG